MNYKTKIIVFNCLLIVMAAVGSFYCGMKHQEQIEAEQPHERYAPEVRVVVDPASEVIIDQQEKEIKKLKKRLYEVEGRVENVKTILDEYECEHESK